MKSSNQENPTNTNSHISVKKAHDDNYDDCPCHQDDRGNKVYSYKKWGNKDNNICQTTASKVSHKINSLSFDLDRCIISTFIISLFLPLIYPCLITVGIFIFVSAAVILNFLYLIISDENPYFNKAKEQRPFREKLSSFIKNSSNWPIFMAMIALVLYIFYPCVATGRFLTFSLITAVVVFLIPWMI
jgi:hypothetical protein